MAPVVLEPHTNIFLSLDGRHGGYLWMKHEINEEFQSHTHRQVGLNVGNRIIGAASGTLEEHVNNIYRTAQKRRPRLN